MGFMGIKHYNESDNAAEFHQRLVENLNNIFHEELKDEANEYNTPGWMNILLILKTFPDFIHFVDHKFCQTIWDHINVDLNEKGYLKYRGGKALVDNFKKLCKQEEK